MNQQSQGNNDRDYKALLIWVALIFRALTLSVEVFLHKGRTFGERYLGLQAAVAPLLMLLFPLLFPRHDPRPMLWLLFAYLAMCGAARLRLTLRRRRSGHVHSLYTGQPRLGRLLRFASEITIKRFIEPPLVFTAGVLLLPRSEPLGCYLMLAGFALFATVNQSIVQERVRALEMSDAFLDQRSLAERFRDMRGN
jgi:hypothetical protein